MYLLCVVLMELCGMFRVVGNGGAVAGRAMWAVSEYAFNGIKIN